MNGRRLRIPTIEEMARIKGWLVLRRNAVRDHLDLSALASRLGDRAGAVLASLDDYYADQLGPDGRRVATQLAKQLAEPRPYDLDDVDLSRYRNLVPEWRSWQVVAARLPGARRRHARPRGGGPDMTVVHRHLDIAPGTPPENLPLDAVDDLLDRGDFDDWRPLVVALRRDPNGELAERILRLCRSHPMYGTSHLWPALIARLRDTGDGAGATTSLAALRRRRGRAQAEVARILGISQSDVSKLERRSDVRVSTLRRYVAALGGELELIARFPEDCAGAASTAVDLLIGPST